MKIEFQARRDFLRGVGGTVALGMLPQAAQGERKKPIPVGFFGATYSHAPGKLERTMSSPDWLLIGAADDTVGGQRTCKTLGVPVKSREELLSMVDVIVIGSPVRDHAPDAIEALKAGKHVHLEKPPAMNMQEMEEVIELARKKDRLVQSGYMWRYNPGFEAILEAAREGWLGDIYMVRGFIGKHLNAERRREWAEFEGGSMFELGSHLIDAVVRLMGRPNRVTPFLAHHGDFDDTLMDNNIAVFEYDNALATVTNTSLQDARTPQRSFEVLGTNGTATLLPIEQPELKLDLVKAAGPYKKGAQEIPMPNYNRYQADFMELAAAVRGETNLRVSLDEELLSAEILFKASGM